MFRTLMLLVGIGMLGTAQARKPNIVFIMTDDQGYADLSCYGSTVIKTPRIDALAKSGIRFTHFRQSAAQCTPARASVLTGCYAQRVNMEGVIFPNSKKGLHPDEITLADLLKEQGYATALIGKWHLGDATEFLPTRQGFDFYYGIPYSNNMKPYVIIRGEEVVEENYDQELITQRFTDEAIQFIDQHEDQPFLLCLWQPQPHGPVSATEKFRNKSGFGTYGASCEEIDFHTGRLLDHLKAEGLEKDTLVIYTSDNGPVNFYGHPNPEVGGSAFPLKGGKAVEYEGGFRVPFIMSWPGTLPAGKESDLALTGIDLMPMLAGLAGAKVPADHVIDGQDVWSKITDNGSLKDRPYYYYHYNSLDGVVLGKWKLMVPRSNREDWYFYYKNRPKEALKLFGEGDAESIPLTLYNLEDDPSETTNVLGQYPEVGSRLVKLLEKARLDLGDNRKGYKGKGRRPAGMSAE